MNTMLIIEDNKLLAECISMVLEKTFPDKVILEANTLKDGLKIVDSINPDVIILDHVFSEGSGLEILNNNSVKAHKPQIIYTSGSLEPEVVKEIQSLGVKTILEKPYEVVDLVKIISGFENKMGVSISKTNLDSSSLNNIEIPFAAKSNHWIINRLSAILIAFRCMESEVLEVSGEISPQAEAIARYSDEITSIIGDLSRYFKEQGHTKDE
ncbi:response regulator [Myxococcota bacterium]|nr:response regulator [Myxococcota bacterium]MBU1382590.1 response regulator [Myxococcota bacterium]MBU1495807.1 response regulator [Myxococcota bacterium]